MSDKRMWGVLIHLGMNQWHDHYMERIKRAGTWAGIPNDDYLEHIRSQYQTADHVRFDEATWREVSESYAENGVNTIVLDLGEAFAYPSHPELWVKGSWSVEKLQAELARLRELGFEVLPKLNFSASHCAWLKDYARMLSTPDYYRVCADVIRDVCTVFGRPRLFHIGMDEERITHHKCCSYACARQGELWWHDLDFLCREVEKCGARPWMWIDHIAEKAEETKAFERLPKKTMMSPWYYHLRFDPAKTWEIRVMHDLDRHGYDMIPCGSICFFDNDSVERLSEYCEAHFDKTRLFGYLNAPWLEMNAFFKDRLILAGESVGRARKAVER